MVSIEPLFGAITEPSFVVSDLLEIRVLVCSFVRNVHEDRTRLSEYLALVGITYVTVIVNPVLVHVIFFNNENDHGIWKSLRDYSSNSSTVTTIELAVRESEAIT
jgi:hypothetical protein